MKLWRNYNMTKKSIKPENISVEDMQVWTEYIATGVVHDENHAKQLTRLGKRSINLADVSTIVDFMSRRNDGYISGLIEQIGVLDKVIAKLGATEDMRKEAMAEYDKELTALQAEVEEAQKAMMAQIEKGE